VQPAMSEHLVRNDHNRSIIEIMNSHKHSIVGFSGVIRPSMDTGAASFDYNTVSIVSTPQSLDSIITIFTRDYPGISSRVAMMYNSHMLKYIHTQSVILSKLTIKIKRDLERGGYENSYPYYMLVTWPYQLDVSKFVMTPEFTRRVIEIDNYHIEIDGSILSEYLASIDRRQLSEIMALEIYMARVIELYRGNESIPIASNREHFPLSINHNIARPRIMTLVEALHLKMDLQITENMFSITDLFQIEIGEYKRRGTLIDTSFLSAMGARDNKFKDYAINNEMISLCNNIFGYKLNNRYVMMGRADRLMYAVTYMSEGLGLRIMTFLMELISKELKDSVEEVNRQWGELSWVPRNQQTYLSGFLYMFNSRVGIATYAYIMAFALCGYGLRMDANSIELDVSETLQKGRPDYLERVLGYLTARCFVPLNFWNNPLRIMNLDIVACNNVAAACSGQSAISAVARDISACLRKNESAESMLDFSVSIHNASIVIERIRTVAISIDKTVNVERFASLRTHILAENLAFTTILNIIAKKCKEEYIPLRPGTRFAANINQVEYSVTDAQPNTFARDCLTIPSPVSSMLTAITSMYTTNNQSLSNEDFYNMQGARLRVNHGPMFSTSYLMQIKFVQECSVNATTEYYQLLGPAVSSTLRLLGRQREEAMPMNRDPFNPVEALDDIFAPLENIDNVGNSAVFREQDNHLSYDVSSSQYVRLIMSHYQPDLASRYVNNLTSIMAPFTDLMDASPNRVVSEVTMPDTWIKPEEIMGFRRFRSTIEHEYPHYIGAKFQTLIHGKNVQIKYKTVGESVMFYYDPFVSDEECRGKQIDRIALARQILTTGVTAEEHVRRLAAHHGFVALKSKRKRVKIQMISLSGDMNIEDVRKTLMKYTDEIVDVDKPSIDLNRPDFVEMDDAGHVVNHNTRYLGANEQTLFIFIIPGASAAPILGNRQYLKMCIADIYISLPNIQLEGFGDYIQVDPDEVTYSGARDRLELSMNVDEVTIGEAMEAVRNSNTQEQIRELTSDDMESVETIFPLGVRPFTCIIPHDEGMINTEVEPLLNYDLNNNRMLNDDYTRQSIDPRVSFGILEKVFAPVLVKAQKVKTFKVDKALSDLIQSQLRMTTEDISYMDLEIKHLAPIGAIADVTEKAEAIDVTEDDEDKDLNAESEVAAES